MISQTLAIVVVAYNRCNSLKRLLGSVSNIKTLHTNIPLIISIDFNGENQDVIEVANTFQWKYGKKEVLTHKTKLGLKNHILKCGNLTRIYDAVIILEDDLFVSPFFYDYTFSCMEFYKAEDNVAGVSLYSYERAESANFKFKPIYDSFDTYFMQFPCSWGQSWNRKQWNNFINWLEQNKSDSIINALVPNFIKVWPYTSWKKLFAAYLMAENKYIVYPKIGLSTNFGDIGQHHIAQLNIRQVDILSKHMMFKFPNFNETNAKYDVGFELLYDELLKLNPKLLSLPKFDVDFYCRKNHKPKDIILTAAKTKHKLHSFSGKLFPLINNVIFNIEGDNLVLCKFKHANKESVGIYKTKFYAEFWFLIKELFKLLGKKFGIRN